MRQRVFLQRADVVKLCRIAAAIYKVIALKIVAVHKPVAHKRLRLSQQRYVVIQPENLRAWQNREDFTVAEVERQVVVVRKTELRLVELFDDLDGAIVGLLKQDVDALHKAATRVVSKRSVVVLVDEALVEVALGREVKSLGSKDRHRKLRRSRVFVIVISPPVSKTDKPLLHKRRGDVAVEARNSRGRVDRSFLDDKKLIVSNCIYIATRWLTVSARNIDAPWWVVIVCKEQKVINQADTRNKIRRAEVEGGIDTTTVIHANDMVCGNLSARVERDNKVELARIA